MDDGLPTQEATAADNSPHSDVVQKTPEGLPIEETPVIEAVAEAPAHEVAASEAIPQVPDTSALPKKPKKSVVKKLLSVIFFLVLFSAGVWLSSVLRQFIPSEQMTSTLQPTPSPSASGFEESAVSTPSGSISAYSDWENYIVINGVTKQPIEGVSYKLPPQVLEPICDSSRCVSQGTYLPGGTRFTVAARGKGQLLPSVGNAVLTDVSGKAFTMKDVLVAGFAAKEFTGTFTGTTGGGYAFTRMRGVILPVDETLSIEFNHFAPAGLTVDFEEDDAVFDRILATFTTGTKPVISITATPTFAPQATSSAIGSFCGGIMGIVCPTGYWCKLDGVHPDAGGTCVAAE